MREMVKTNPWKDARVLTIFPWHSPALAEGKERKSKHVLVSILRKDRGEKLGKQSS